MEFLCVFHRRMVSLGYHVHCHQNKRTQRLFITLDSRYKVTIAEWPLWCFPLPTDTDTELSRTLGMPLDPRVNSRVGWSGLWAILNMTPSIIRSTKPFQVSRIIFFGWKWLILNNSKGMYNSHSTMNTKAMFFQRRSFVIQAVSGSLFCMAN